MKFGTTDLIDAGLITLGTGIALSDIHQILSIIILVLNAMWILLKFILKFFKYYSNDGKIDKEELDDLLDDVNKNIKEDDKDE